MTQRYTMESQLREQAQRDPEFRARLLENPQATVGDHLGIDVDDVTIRVIEEQPGEVVIVLPPTPVESTELTDAELSTAAGGWNDTQYCSFPACADG